MKLGRRKASPDAAAAAPKPKREQPPRRARKPRPPRPSFKAVAKAAARWLFVIRWNLLTIERYVFGEVWSHFLLGVLGFTFFMIITSLFTLGDKIFGKHIPPFTVMKVLLLSTPAYLILAIPVACLFATLMAMGRLSRDNELTAMYTTGVSLYRIFLPFLALAMFAGVLSYSVYEYVVPPNNREFKNTLAVFWESQVVDFIKPKMVIGAPGRKYFYIDEVDKEAGVMRGIRVYDYGEGRSFPRMFLADDARMDQGYLVLNNVRVYEPEARDGGSMVSVATPNTKLDIARKIREFYAEEAPQELSTNDLRRRVQQSQREMKASLQPSRITTLKYNTDNTEYYFKFALPFASIVLVLVAVPISIRGPREERNMALILAFLLVMAYYALFFACRTLGYLGHLPAMAAGWIPNTFFVTASVFLFLRARK